MRIFFRICEYVLGWTGCGFFVLSYVFEWLSEFFTDCAEVMQLKADKLDKENDNDRE